MPSGDSTEITSVGDALFEAIDRPVSDGGYDQILIFTYSVKTDYLKRFSEDQEVLICGRDAVVDTVERADVGDHISAQPVEFHKSHAKCYLFWNETEMCCWLGSFNFTRSGLHQNIEWTIEETAPVRTAPSIDDVLAGRPDPTRATQSKLLGQVLDTIGAIATGTEADWTTDIRQSDYPYAVLSNRPTNTLRMAIAECLIEAESNVSITYFAPYVSRQGVYTFAKTLPASLNPAEISMQVRTCRVKEMEAGAETHLTEADIADLEGYFGQFDHRVRAAGDTGTELTDGRRLRNGFAHFKLLCLCYTDHAGERQQDTLFTTANLTNEAWRPRPESLELGVWIRSGDFAAFYLDRLRPCYVEPSDRELREIDTDETGPTLVTERYLSDHLEERLSITEDALSLQWADLQWPVERIEGTVHLRDVRTGEPREYDTTFSLRGDGAAWTASLSGLAIGSSEVITRVDLSVETRLAARERRLTDAVLDPVRNDNAARDELVGAIVDTVETQCPGWKQLVWNGTIACDRDTAFERAPDDITDVWVRETRPAGATHPHSVVLPVKTQPHLGAAFITDTTVETQTIEPLGTLLRVHVVFDPAVDPAHDMLAFETVDGDAVPFYGFTTTEQGVAYLFDNAVAESGLKAHVQPPYQRYYEDSTATIELEQPHPSDSETAALAQSLRKDVTYQFSHHVRDMPPVSGGGPENQESFITDEVEVAIQPADQLVTEADGQTEAFGYLWRRLTARYRAPEWRPVDEPIQPSVPHSRIEYQGTLEVPTPAGPVTLLTRPNQFTVFERAFASRIIPHAGGVDFRDLSSLTADDLLLWVVFSRDELLRDDPALSGEGRIKFDAWVDGEPLPKTREYPVCTEGELFCIPLFGNSVGRDRALTLSLRLSDVPGTFAARAPRVPISVSDGQTGDQELTVRWGPEPQTKIPLKHAPGQNLPTLDRFADRIRTRALREALEGHDHLTVTTTGRSQLTIDAARPVVLHLGSGAE